MGNRKCEIGRREAEMGFGDEIPKQVWAAAQRPKKGLQL